MDPTSGFYSDFHAGNVNAVNRPSNPTASAIGYATAERDGVDPIAAERVCDPRLAAEQSVECGVVNVQPPRVGAEGRHDTPKPVGQEAAAARHPAGGENLGDGMKMPRDLAWRSIGPRLVSQKQGTKLPFGHYG